jgi:hypothetical protein
VLDVHGRVDVDAGVEQFDDVLPALGVSTARRVRVGELVDEDQRRVAGERGVEIEFAQRGAAIVDRFRWEDLEPGKQGVGLGATVSLDVADDRIDAVELLLAHRLEHRVRLPDAGGSAEEHLQLPATLARFFRLDSGQERLRVWPVGTHDSSVAPGARRHSKGYGGFGRAACVVSSSATRL